MQVAPTDVDDESHPRPRRGDIREVLLLPDAQIDAAGRDRSAEARHDRRKMISSEAKLSERKKPSGSERASVSLQNSRSESCAGRSGRATTGGGTMPPTPNATASWAAAMRPSRVIDSFGRDTRAPGRATPAPPGALLPVAPNGAGLQGGGVPHSLRSKIVGSMREARRLGAMAATSPTARTTS